MSAVLVLWLMCGFLANLPTAFSRPKWLIDGSGSRIKADESAKRQSSSGCGSYNYLNNTLASPGYPSNYPSYMDCEYQVPIPSGKAMRINFDHFHLEGGSCSYDYLEITNNRNQTVGKYCGLKSGFYVDVSGDYVVLKFHSDSSFAYTGYFLSFTAFSNGTQSPPTSLPTVPPTTAGGLCGFVQNNELVSPGYPNYYPHNTDCVYYVYIPYGKALQIYFYVFGVNDCGYDYLKISNLQNQTFGSYCGTQTGKTVIVTGVYAVLTFHSDGILNDQGYKLFFSYVSQVNVSTPAPWPTYTTYPTYPTFTSPSKPFPSIYPSMDPKCKLRTYIQILARLLYEMDNIVRYELNSNFSAREYKARVKRALSDVQTAMSKGGRHRRDVKKVQMIDEMERKAAELLKRLDTKEAQSKMRVLLNKKMAEKN